MILPIGRLLTSATAATLMIAATPCWAWGDDQSETREVYRDNLTVRLPNGKLGHAILAFSVTATTYVGEDGNANFPDNRACYYRDVRRTLVRTLSLNMPDGTVVPIRDTTLALPSAGGKSWGQVTPCNDKIAEIHSDLVAATGSADTWQTYIDGEKSEVRRLLSQFGQVV